MAVHDQVEWRSGSTLKLTSLGERQLHRVSPGPTICPSSLSFALSRSRASFGILGSQFHPLSIHWSRPIALKPDPAQCSALFGTCGWHLSWLRAGIDPS